MDKPVLGKANLVMLKRSPHGAQQERIQGVAAKLFAKNGYHATGVAELSDAVKLGRGALYYHILSKESLLFEICRVPIEQILTVAEDIASRHSRPDEQLRLLARAHMKNIAEHLPEWTVFFRELGSLTGKRREEILRLRDRYEQFWHRAMVEGARQKVFRETHPILVKILLGSLNYTYLWMRPDGPLSPEQIADAFCDAVLRGLLALPTTEERGQSVGGSIQQSQRMR